MDKETSEPGSGKQPTDTPSSVPRDEGRKEIPLVSVPNDDDLIAEEMAEMFEEDQVTHKHGSTEPEGD